MTKTQLNIELESEFIAVLDILAGKALKRQGVARMLLIGALEAVQANANMVHLPPKFVVADGQEVKPASTTGAKPLEGTRHMKEETGRFDQAVRSLVTGAPLKSGQAPKAKHPKKALDRQAKASGVPAPSGPATS